MQIYQVVRKIVDEESQYGGATSRLSVSVVYERIKRSNSSLNRKNKKLLTDSIERVLAVSREGDQGGDDSDTEEELATMEQDSVMTVQVSCQALPTS